MLARLVLALVLALFSSSIARGSGELAPPFGLEWGGSPQRLADWSERFELDLLVKTPGGNPEQSVLMISSSKGALPGHEATSLEGRFREARLYEVGVHYTYPGRGTDFVEARFVKLKRLLARKYREFRLSGRQKDVKDGISTTSEAYHLEPAPGFLIVLARTVVVDQKRGDKAMRFSVVYRSEHHATPPPVQTAGALPDGPPVQE